MSGRQISPESFTHGSSAQHVLLRSRRAKSNAARVSRRKRDSLSGTSAWAGAVNPERSQ